MSSGAHETSLNEIDLEALRWLGMMEHGALSSQEQLRFQAWVAADIRHKGAIIRARAASLRLERLAALAGGRSVVQSPAPRAILPSRNITRRGMLVAAAAAAGLVGITAWLGRDWLHEAPAGTLYTSNVGELKKVTLQDGSVLTMNTQTELRVNYTRERRDISLIRGEVMFTVAHDAARPFGVRVGKWTALAVGTEFAAHRLDEATADITVTEGVVQMLSPDRNVADAGPRLTANQKATVSGGGAFAVSQMSATEMGAELAWRTHLVVFSGVPLRDALVEMNRYSRKRIRVDDPEISQRRIVGVFSTVDSQTFISSMKATLGVEAVESGDTVLLRNMN
ncbi:MAG TPA: FecR domain-containing protein [Steroidobacteraceae bacterium]